MKSTSQGLVLLLASAALGLRLEAVAQVRSLTLGIDVNSPYGLSEPWPGLREELEKFASIASVSERPCVKTETCEVRTRGGRLLDAKQLADFIRGTGLGASLRGVEATVDGVLERRDGEPVLRLTETNAALRLAPLTRKVQFDFDKKEPHPASAEERRAFTTLLAQWTGGPRAVRIIGPVVKARIEPLSLEVRQFEFLPASNGPKKQL